MISILATTYNQARDLELYLKTLTMQTDRDFELVIADDGSTADTRTVIERYQREHFGDRLKHVWHEDAGYRKCKILNAAIRQSRGDWLIFTDSDLILHPRFVEDHRSQRATNSMFMGRRVDLGTQVSDWIRAHPENLFEPTFYFRVARSSFESARTGQARTRGLKRAFRLSSALLARAIGFERVPDLLGSNFSIDRELLYRVNGFDESREHYWGEDGDLFVRVRNAGARISGRKSFAVQFHLWHPQRSPQPDAESAYRRMLQDHQYVRCANGLSGGPQ